MKESQRDPQFKLRLPAERLDWLKARAEANNRTVTTEINFILMSFKKMEDEGKVPKMA